MASEHRTDRAGPSNVMRKPSPSVFDLATAIALNFPAYDCIVAVEQIMPNSIAQRLSPLCRVDYIGEHDRRKHAIRVQGRSRPGQKFHHFVNDAIGVTDPLQMVDSRQLDVFCIRILRARKRPASTLTLKSPSRWMISVGTRIEGSMGRTSISLFMRVSVAAAEGLALKRSKRACASLEA
jgi:hypothetical protein